MLKKRHFKFCEFSLINIPSRLFGKLSLFNSPQSLRPFFMFVGFAFQFLELSFYF